ncbi:hypothetical protein HMPREF9412_4088 [Paenibacillus sp. HGF5]|nr:hypothetical protein HMPREF9412_4088 [Paenibacillus sp. HGF5]
MPIAAVLFDLDDTLLWDERSVEEAFEVTCQAGAAETAVDAGALLAAVREEARALYESYDTFAFTKMIGINPFERACGLILRQDPSPNSESCKNWLPYIVRNPGGADFIALALIMKRWRRRWQRNLRRNAEQDLMYMKKPLKC